MTSAPSPSTAITADEAPSASRGPLIIELLLLASAMVAGGLTFMAGQAPVDLPSQPVGLFYRTNLAGWLDVAGGRLLPWAGLIGAVGLVLVVLAALPRVAPEVRGGTAAYGLLLLLAPVINYGPQREALTLMPGDLPGAPVLNAFNPMLPVSWPLLAGFVLLLVWLATTPRDTWPVTTSAFGFVTLALVLGGWAINRGIVQARGNALMLDYTQWPYTVESLWTIAQLGLATVLVAAASRQSTLSRVAAGLTALLLLATAATLGGAR